MSKRFGRNQLRKMREQLERQKAEAARQSASAASEVARLRGRLARSIEIDVDVLQNHSRFAYEARMSAYKDGRDGYHLAQLIDDRQIAMSRERDQFIEHVAKMMAQKLAHALGEKWGSERDPFREFLA